MVLGKRPLAGFSTNLSPSPFSKNPHDRLPSPGAGSQLADLKVTAFINDVFRQATDPTMIGPMLLAAPAYHLGKATALRSMLANPGASWLARGMKLKALPAALGFGAEVAVFSLGSRSLTHLARGAVPWDLRTVMTDMAMAGMTLGLLKLGGALGTKGMLRLRGLNELQPQHWSQADHRALFWTSQVSAYLGLVGSHTLQTKVFPETRIPGSNVWIDSLGAHLALGLGGSAGRRLLGSRFNALERQLILQEQQLSQEVKAQGSSFGLPSRALAVASGPAGAHVLTASGGLEAAGERIFKSESSGEGGIPPVTSSLPPVLSPLPAGFPGPGAKVLRGKYVVIGNRGEPAVRAANTVKEMGGIPVVLVTQGEVGALHATLNGVIPLRLKEHVPRVGEEKQSPYLVPEIRVAALREFMESRGIEPDQVIAWEGWGFLSESGEWFEQMEKLGIRIAAAPSGLHYLMGDKVSARKLAREAGVPVVEGSGEVTSVAEAKKMADKIGYPVIVKGKDTGGGKGIREVHKPEDFERLFTEAQQQAFSTSKSRVMFVEKFIPAMRHLEAQIVADGQGNFVLMGIRECTLQRQKQKVIEEDVTTSLDPAVKSQAEEIAAKIMGHEKMERYLGPGTLEMIWDVATDRLYFMEMNTRLQVEHTVTEMVTGKNLLKAQLELGAGLPLSFDKVHPYGHAIEVRITSEDPFNNFIPSTGRILHYREPQAHKTGRIRVRVDSGVEVGREINSDFDSMIAKLIVWGETREYALEGLKNALDQFEILGLKTNIPFLKKLVASEQFQDRTWGNTRFIEEVFLPSEAGKPDYPNYSQALVTAAIQTFLKRKDAIVTSRQKQLQGVKIDPKVEMEFQGRTYPSEVYEVGPGEFQVKIGSQLTQVELIRVGDNLFNIAIDGIQRRALIYAPEGRRDVNINNIVYEIKIEGEGDLGPGAVKSPMAGKVTEVLVKPGDVVKRGDTVAVIEAMKNFTRIGSEVDGVVKAVHVGENQQVQEGILLVEVEAEQGPTAGAEKSGPKPSPEPAVALSPAPLEILRQKEWKKKEIKGLQTLIGNGLGQSNPEELDRAKKEYAQKLDLSVEDLETEIQREQPEMDPKDRRILQDQLRSYFRGFDAPLDILLELLPSLNGKGLGAAEELQGLIVDLIESYSNLESLFLPANWTQWVQFRQMGVFTGEGYETQLNQVLGEYGVQNTEPGARLEETLFRIGQSHHRRREKAQILEKLLPLIPEFKMKPLDGPLGGLARLYVDGVPKSFSTQVTEHQRLLQRKISGAEEIKTLERIFQEIIVSQDHQVEKKMGELFRHAEEVVPFLIGQTLRIENPAASQMAFQLLNEYHYREHYQPGEYQTKSQGHFVTLTPHPGLKEKGVQIALMGISGPLNREKFEEAVFKSFNYFPELSDSVDHRPLRALEIVVPGITQPEAFKKYLEASPELFKDRFVDRLTLIFQKAPNHVTYRTYERSPDGAMVENPLLRGIHPMMVGDFRLQRWTENFDIAHLDHILPDVHNVLIYQAEAKSSGEAPVSRKQRDQRHLVIGEHKGPLTLEKFEGERVLNRLISDLRHLKQNPDYSLDEDSTIAWKWLPAVLMHSGILGNGYDPFSLGALRTTPAEMIDRFNLDEAMIRKVAPFYHGRVKSAPEVERLVHNVGNALEQVRHEGIPAVADIFIRQPIEMTNEEITMLAYRLAPQVVGKFLEKTTVHFKRVEEGKIKPYIAQITIPGETRFNVEFRPAKTDLPPHRVRSVLQRKRLEQQVLGRTYVYDTVELFRNVLLEEFYPQGNVPPDPITIREMVLGEDGRLVFKDPEPAKNNLSKVAFEISLKLPLGPDGEQPVTRTFVVLADDYTVNFGSMSRKAGRLYKAAIDHAIEKGIPQLYLAESVGAFIGFPTEVWPFLEFDQDSNQMFVRTEAMETPVPEAGGRPLKDLILAGEALEDGRVPVRAILGDGENNTESLEGSGMAGEAQDRAYRRIPTATIVMGPSVGITTYLAQWSKFIIMLKNSFLGLTGRLAINNTYGTTYETEAEIHGPDVMSDNGVSSRVAEGPREALEYYLRWLSYQPVRVGQEAPRFEGGTSVAERNIAGVLQTFQAQGEDRPSTKILDQALLDPGTVFYVKDDGMWGRRVNVGYGRLGGIPLGFASMERRPKKAPGEREEELFPGSLGPQDALKLADHIEQVNRLGIAFLFIDNLTGFNARLVDHQNRVIPAGAQILSALRTFQNPFINLVQPYGYLFGGAMVVVETNVNPNIVVLAFDTSQLGILGSAASIDLPKLKKIHRGDPGAIRKARLMLDLQNSPQRALQVGSIHQLIEDPARAPLQIHKALTQKTAEINTRREAQQRQKDLLQQVTGVLQFRDWQYQMLPDGMIKMQTPQGPMTTTLEMAHLVLRGTNPFEGFREGDAVRETQPPPPLRVDDNDD